MKQGKLLAYVRNGDTTLQNALGRQLNSGAEYKNFKFNWKVREVHLLSYTEHLTDISSSQAFMKVT